MTVTVPELVSEAPLRTQRAVCFSCWKIFEVKQSSVKKERVFHTQECKMLHNSAEILILCIRISKFYNYMIQPDTVSTKTYYSIRCDTRPFSSFY